MGHLNDRGENKPLDSWLRLSAFSLVFTSYSGHGAAWDKCFHGENCVIGHETFFFFFCLIKSPVEVGEAVPRNVAGLGTYLEHTVVRLCVRRLAFPKRWHFSVLFPKLNMRLDCVVDLGP